MLPRRLSQLTAVTVTGLFTAGCTLIGGGDGGDDDASSATTVTLATHDSFAVPQRVLDDFESRSGIRVEVLNQGDAGALANKLVLTKANPVADVAYGIDSTFASRTLAENVFAPYAPPAATEGPQRYALDDAGDHGSGGDGARLTAVDVGDVCVNIDTEWFASRDMPAPRTFADLARPQYSELLVTPSPATSSPGLAFLLATVADRGEDGWQDYWRKLKEGGAQVVSGWSEAYTQEFSGSSGNGPRPIVVSYASSPAAEIGDDGTPRTEALLETCYRQVEYAGVLSGTDRPDEARRVVDFLLSPEFQRTVPENMYVYPARSDIELPGSWQRAAPLPDDPAQLPADEVSEGREQWIEQWRALYEG
ncbi:MULTISPECIES: thiamine ABC transporter substrate-binding protein [Prauserella salsuginis group]|uniref:Thiamine ABC transporter substrate binding subunit n=1 Tax=Prauserella salsuginis TaxID=387889 RepID=A0ABW6GAX5_9PSEU|nr:MULTISPECIES: thiamine ABC transporter substrate-binding protein [Prauserella salsuginis group]MCR3722379.1 thiamine transport system substrate-binding protein [Prauserella flava]MCR3736821.1 thiamine transport system substrate-binding protein [Prauserella salsuginis]